MQRPDVHTLACVNAACQLCRHAGANPLVIRTGYGPAHIRLLRCRHCGEECSERRGTALGNTKLPEVTAEEVMNHVGEGWRVRATARRVHVAKETGARLVRVAGRHAARCPNQHVPGLTPTALAGDEQWRVGKKSQSVVRPRQTALAICGTLPPWPQTAHWWSVSS